MVVNTTNILAPLVLRVNYILAIPLAKERISDKKKHILSRACALTRRTTVGRIIIYIQKIPLKRTTRLARSRSPIIGQEPLVDKWFSSLIFL